jgi:hypothetical protein
MWWVIKVSEVHENGGSMDLWNVGILPPTLHDVTTQKTSTWICLLVHCVQKYTEINLISATKQFLSVMLISQAMIRRKDIEVCVDNQMEYVNTFWGSNAVLLNVKAGGTHGYQYIIKI